MHLIFQRAELTVVAAVDNFDGLLGVRGGRPSSQREREVQKRVQLGDMTLVTVMDVEQLIQESEWFHRGWTFQEGLLSRRVLVFTDSQLYWNCCVMTQMESIYVPMKVSHNSDGSQWSEWMPYGIFTRSSKRDLQTSTESHTEVQENPTSSPDSDQDSDQDSSEDEDALMYSVVCRDITQYTSRKLSDTKDSLNAFKGVMQMYVAGINSNTRFILGLPIVIGPGLNVNSAFAYVLYDWDSEYGCRRSHLPSWSWAGWGARTLIGICSEKYSYYITYRSGYVSYCPELRLVEDLDDPRGIPVETILEETRCFDRYATLRVVKPYKIGKMHASLRVMMNISLSKDIPEVLPAREDFAFVLISCDQETLTEPRFLILEPIDENQRVWERVGAASVVPDCAVIISKRDLKTIYPDSESIPDDRNELWRHWESLSTFVDLIKLANLVPAEVDYFIK
ncbi:uncharacterized protein F4822DRAFT_186502 [Hypoxylon trugodes]|uniref:uncharacterized protein n=1 Tax=Hypoxylon trugodes TaxID=326681 RepID=UPI0021A07528|nr:uncharacterized protein F4822DRAFT_186502 [Hypoxylon trugodes]KAI1391461.1 hypothetical protein F4822DRAFT_186502 [Hypoxylon trugodes]